MQRFLDLDDPEGATLFRQIESDVFKIAHMTTMYFKRSQSQTRASYELVLRRQSGAELTRLQKRRLKRLGIGASDEARSQVLGRVFEGILYNTQFFEEEDGTSEDEGLSPQNARAS
ncbi:unnamed protein product, partial [Amoebophrya sp. A25]|eukprot:GSA25T00024329001.1